MKLEERGDGGKGCVWNHEGQFTTHYTGNRRSCFFHLNNNNGCLTRRPYREGQ